MTYDIGQVYQASIDVTGDDGVTPQNPSAAALTVTHWTEDDGAVIEHPTVTLPPAITGHVTHDYLLAEPGTYCFDWVTEDPNGSTTDYITARKYRAVLPLAEAADWLGVDDPRLMRKIRACLGLATKKAEDVVGITVPVRYSGIWIPGTTREVLRVPFGPILTETSVETVAAVYPGGPAWSQLAGDFIVNPRAGTIRLSSGLDFWYGPWKSTWTAGRVEIGENIIGGVREILWDLWATQRNLTMDADSPELTEVAAWEAAIGPGYQIPGRAAELLSADEMPTFG